MANKGSGLAQDPKQLAAIICFGGVILGVLFYFLYYSDLEAEHTKIVAAQKKQQDVLTALKEENKKLFSITEEARCLKKKIVKTEKQLPRGVENLDRFVNSVNKEAKNHDIKLALLRRLEPEDGELFLRVPYELEFYGNFNEVADFFWKISELDANQGEQIINVMGFSFQRGYRRDTHPEKMIKVTALVETYLYSAELIADDEADAQGSP